MQFLQALAATVFVFGLLVWVYVVLIQLTHENWLALSISHIDFPPFDWRLDEVGIVSLLVSILALFFLGYMRQTTNYKSRHRFQRSVVKRWGKPLLIVSLLLAGTVTYACYLQTLSIPYFYMPNLVWQTHFEDGTFSAYNSEAAVGCGYLRALTPSPYVHHTISSNGVLGNHSEFDYYDGPPNSSLNSTLPCGAYQILNLTIPPYNAYDLDDLEVSITIMVPSHMNGEQVNVTDWISFISVSTGSLNDAWTINSGKSRDLYLWLACKDYVNSDCKSGIIPSVTPYRWRFDDPFTIHAVYMRSTDVLDQRIVIWVQDFSGSFLIVNYTGRTAPTLPGRYQYYRFGLYIGPDQGTIGWYENDIELSIQ